MFFRRIPRLEQIVVNPRFVDGCDCCVSISVGCQEHALRIGMENHGLFQKLDARQSGHSLIDEEECDGAIPQLQLPNNLHCRAPRFGSQHAIIARILASQIALDCAQDLAIIIQRQQYRFSHIDFFSRVRPGRY